MFTSKLWRKRFVKVAGILAVLALGVVTVDAAWAARPNPGGGGEDDGGGGGGGGGGTTTTTSTTSPPPPPPPIGGSGHGFQTRTVRPAGLCADVTVLTGQDTPSWAGLTGPCGVPLQVPTPTAPGGDCAGPGGTFDRPAGVGNGDTGYPASYIAPGYVYTPTTFDGNVEQPAPRAMPTDAASPVPPQADDTFAADAPGHPTHTGHLVTRTANGREEFLVCAHVGTNFPDFALTPFPSTSPAHPPTIAPTVIARDAAGRTSTYTLDTPGLTDAVLAHYDGSTDVREGYLRMWVPFTPLNGSAAPGAPGFQVRVEVRGTTATPLAGTAAVFGADEAQVHLGPAPVARNEVVHNAVGVAIDDSAVLDAPSDPGPDDLQSILDTVLSEELPAAVSGYSGAFFPSDYDWTITTDVIDRAVSFVKADARLESVSLSGVGLTSLSISPVGGGESQLLANASGNVSVSLRVWPRSVGVATITSGHCDVTAQATVSAGLSARLGLSESSTRPEPVLDLLGITADVTNTHVMGTLGGYFFGLPQNFGCSDFADEVRERIERQAAETVIGATYAPGTDAAIAEALDPDLLADLDLGTGPYSQISVATDNGGGFGVDGWHYEPTATNDQLGGHVLIWSRGIDVAAGGAITDKGGTRFPHSARPSGATAGVIASTHGRTRPDGSGFDVGAIVNGSSVNQLARALSAGAGEGSGLLDIDTTIGGSTVTTRPSSALQYVPTPPSGWPTSGAVQAYIPSLRVNLPSSPVGATMAADVYVGANVSINTQTNQIDASPNTVVKARFLHLTPSLNFALDRDPSGRTSTDIENIASLIQAVVPGRVTEMLEGIQVPNLSNFLVNAGLPNMVISNLSMGTVGGAHLGVFVNVDPNPGRVDISVEWHPDLGATLHLTTTGFPPSGAQEVLWEVRDGATGNVVFESQPGTVGATYTDVDIPASSLHEFVYNPCEGLRWIRVTATATVTRAGVTSAGTGEDTSYFMGPALWTAEQCGNQP